VLAPDSQLAARKSGAFAHTMHAIMSGAPIASKNLWINPFSIIPYPQPKLPGVIVYFNFYLTRLRVPECIAQRLACDPVDFVAEYGMEIPRGAFHLYPTDGRRLIGSINRQFFSCSPYSLGNIVGLYRG
jgi:hypothetical protein